MTPRLGHKWMTTSVKKSKSRGSDKVFKASSAPRFSGGWDPPKCKLTLLCCFIKSLPSITSVRNPSTTCIVTLGYSRFPIRTETSHSPRLFDTKPFTATPHCATHSDLAPHSYFTPGELRHPCPPSLRPCAGDCIFRNTSIFLSFLEMLRNTNLLQNVQPCFVPCFLVMKSMLKHLPHSCPAIILSTKTPTKMTRVRKCKTPPTLDKRLLSVDQTKDRQHCKRRAMPFGST